MKTRLLTRRLARALAFLGVALAAGCVELEQEILMNHDGSGRIVEKMALSPRGARMAEGAARRAGGNAGAPALFSEELFQNRLKSMGEVTLESRKEVTLPDGRRQLQATYAFKDLNKVRLWIAPTLRYKLNFAKDNRTALDGSFRMKYQAEYEAWGRIFRETVSVTEPGFAGSMGQPLMTPAERQKFARVLPIFLDMIQDLRLSIVLVAPIEEFEEPKDMLWNLPGDKNRVTLFKVDGQGVAAVPAGVLQLVTDEVIDVGVANAMPGVFMPWVVEYAGRGMRFMKPTPAPKK